MRASETRRRARGCSLGCSAAAARRRNSCGSVVAEGDAVGEFGAALGEGAGLVEGEGVDLREPFERRASLDEDAATGEPGGRGEDSGGGGEHQGAGTGDDQDRERGHDVDDQRAARTRPAPERAGIGEQENERRGGQNGGQEEAGVAVGGAFERGFLFLGGGEQADDAAHRGFGADLSRTHLDAAKLVDGAGVNGVALALVDGEALAGEDGLIDGGAAGLDDAVGGDALAGTDDEEVAHGDFFGGDFDFLAVFQDASGARAVFEEGLDGLLGSAEGEGFEAFAEEGDEDDLGGHEILAQQAGGDAGDGQSDIGANAALEEGGDGEVDDPSAADDGRDEG